MMRWTSAVRTALSPFCRQIVVSHDRTFLNHIVTDIINFADKKLEYYKGDYVNFEKVRTHLPAAVVAVVMV
jgi:ATPase subunit of ABC transporter with duplicated ATPase domains